MAKLFQSYLAVLMSNSSDVLVCEEVRVNGDT